MVGKLGILIWSKMDGGKGGRGGGARKDWVLN